MQLLRVRLMYCVVCCAVATAHGACIQTNHHEGYRAETDVRSSQTGEPLSEWTVVSQITSNMGWSTERSDRTIEETVLLVAAQRPGDNVYEFPAYSDGGIFLLPPVGYGGWKSACAWMFSLGYEPTCRGSRFEVIEARVGDGEAAKPVHRVTYVLSPWNNHSDHLGARTTLSLLSDTKNFEPYEALRGTPQGAGVPKLYEYYIRRFEAIREENPDMPIALAVEKTVAWLREGAGGARPKPLLASPTTTTQRRWGPRPLTESEAADRFQSLDQEHAARVAVVDDHTKLPVDAWVWEVTVMALRRSEPHLQADRLLALDSRTREAAACQIPGVKVPEKGDSGILCRIRQMAVYADGYEPSWLPAEDYRPEGLPVFTYHLRRWNNDDAAGVAAYVGHLEDDKRFDLYRQAEAEGFSGVVPLYRYLLARYDALRPEQRDSLSPGAKRRIDWIRSRVPGEGGGTVVP